MSTFKVDEVEDESKLLPVSEDPLSKIKSMFSRSVVEAVGFSCDANVVRLSNSNGLVSAVGYAYACHFPLELSPSDVHLALCQAIANHIDAHAERLRKNVVTHDGKVNISVRRDDFVKGSNDNDWASCFPEFVTKMGEYTKSDIKELFTKPYSTSTPTDVIATQITLMAGLKNFFSYQFHTMCGIPSVTLRGAPDDWKDLRQRMRQLAEIDPEFQWWFTLVDEMLGEFLNASQGVPNVELWRNLFKRSDESGGPYITGWISIFFPYSDEMSPFYDHTVVKKLSDFYTGEKHWCELEGLVQSEDSVPCGVVAAPFLWEYYDKKFKMSFRTGFFGISQNPKTRAVRPCVAWAVIDTTDESEEQNK